MLNQEIWKDIQGYEGKYQVSDLGNVRNKLTGKSLKGISHKGYFVIWLYLNGNAKRFYVHRLVLTEFISNPENKLCVNHKNGAKTDNRIENLEWVTYLENSQHAHKTGLVDYSKLTGEKNPACKLSELKVLEIRNKHKNGISQLKLSQEYEVTRRTINEIINKKLWRDI